MNRTGYALKTRPAADPWRFRNREFALEISNRTGLISRITSLLPRPVEMTRGEGAALYVRCIDRGWEDRFKTLKAWYAGRGREDGQYYRELVCVVAPENHPVAFAVLRYRIFPERVEMRIRFHSLVRDWCRYRLGYYHRLNRAGWPMHRDTGFEFSDSSSRYIRLYTHAYDRCWEEGDWGTNVFPMGVMKRQDRYVLYGSFDLGPHMVFGPNVPEAGALPSLFLMPMGLQKGETWTLELFFKSFSRTRSEYLEVLRWYAARTRLDHPDLAGIPVRLTQKVSRTVPAGKFVGAPFPGFRGDTPGKLAALKRWMLRTHATNLLYAGWDGWVHPPEELEGAVWQGYMPDLSTERMKKDIAALKRQGFRPYLYLNNFVTPPWIPKGEAGGRLFDPGNCLEREWYVKRVQEAIRLLRPSGIFWDCGWWPIHYAAPNVSLSSDPRSDSLKGWLIVQALLYRWIKANYPEMRVAMNLMAGGSPSQYFTDMIMTEGGGIASPQLLEDSKALMTNVIGYFSVFYYDIFPPVLREHGLAFSQTIATGLPEAVKADLWRRYMARGLKSVGLGASLSGDPNTLVEHTPERRQAFPEYNGYAFYFPISRRTAELDAFCALSNATPLIPSSFVIIAGPRFYGSVWASPDRLLASLYNDHTTRQRVTARIDLGIARQFGLRNPGRLQVTVLDRQGLPAPAALTLGAKAGAVTLRGYLEAGHLALVRTVRPDRSRKAVPEAGKDRTHPSYAHRE